MTPAKKVRACVIYARISLRTEESVSIARQVEAGEAYAKARGWKVLGTYVDDGVSATKNRPEDRDGWNAALAAVQPGSAVVVWKVDRLARRVLDFLTADAALAERGAGIVCVEDPIDMTTATGRAFAQMLAVFGELEAGTMRARQKAARDYLLRAGRSPGGVVLYGYRRVPNPSGAGYVLVQNPETIEYVREMVRRTAAGLSVYSTAQWLAEAGAPTPGGGEEWRHTAVSRIVRHPLIAGMTPHNPGNATSHTRGDDVVRDADGLPIVDPALAVMSVGEWRAMVQRLDDPVVPQRKPQALRGKTSGLLSGLVWCAEHPAPVRMVRYTLSGTNGNRPAYRCQECGQTISYVDDTVVPEFLRVAGAALRLTAVEEVVEGGAVQLQEATVRLGELGREIGTASPDRQSEILAEMARLTAIQEEARALPPQVRMVPVADVRSYAEDWEAAEGNPEQQRAIIGQALDRVLIRRGARGGKGEAHRRARMEFVWRPHGDAFYGHR